MSDAIVIPNVVGRLDPVTLSACLGKRDEVIDQLKAESSRQIEKKTAANKDSDKAEANFKDICNFIELINSSDAAWNQFRRACGWTGDDAGAAVGAKVITGEELLPGGELLPGDEIALETGLYNYVDVSPNGDYRFFRGEGFAWLSPRKIDEILCPGSGVPVYRTINCVRTLISGWPAGKHPAVEEAAKAENELLKAAADEPELDGSRVIQTIYELAGQPNYIGMPSGNLWAALRCIIRSIYSDSDPGFKPYKLKK